MHELLDEFARLSRGHGAVGRAVVTSVWGSAPRQPGACLLANREGEMAGSISGGCVEAAAVSEITSALETNRSRLVSFGVTNEMAWEVGLACGGTIEIMVEPGVPAELIECLKRDQPCVLATLITAGNPTERLLCEENGRASRLAAPGGDGEAGTAVTEPVLQETIVALAREALAVEQSRKVDIDETRQVFLEVHPPRPKLVIVGAVHIAQHLVPMAQTLGYHTTVIDAREGFITGDRFPTADSLLTSWPGEAFGQVGIDSNTFICVLSHDPKFDDPALEIALRSKAKYVGALGSKKTQAKRRARLEQLGLAAAELERLRGPIGLDLGGRDPRETALAILAEMTAVRYGRA